MSKLPAARPGGLALVLALAFALGCGDSDAADADWPPGALLSAHRDALERVLQQIEGLEGTPAARHARAIREALPACAELEARADAAQGLRDALRCADANGALAGLHRHRGDADVALAIPVGDGDAVGGRLLLRASEERGHLRATLHWPRPRLEPAAAALLPGADGAGPPVLASAERVLHVRVRADGPLDLAALVPEGSQADELFRLRSDALSAALLDGTWELAIYPPAEGAGPRIAAALGVRARGPAALAARHFLDDVQATWALERTRTPFGSEEGVCLFGLKLLPDLAPCLVATGRALVVGWNAASLRHALDTSAAPSSPPGAPARVELDLTRLRESDLRLAAAQGGPSPARVVRWPWRRLTAHASRGDDGLAVELDLEAADPEGRGGERGT